MATPCEKDTVMPHQKPSTPGIEDAWTGCQSGSWARAWLLLPLVPLAWPLGFLVGLWQRRRDLWRSRSEALLSGAFVLVVIGFIVALRP
jgi:hypothetical protein